MRILLLSFIFISTTSFGSSNEFNIFERLNKKSFEFIDLRRDLSLPKVNKNKKVLKSKPLVNIAQNQVGVNSYKNTDWQKETGEAIESKLFDEKVDIKKQEETNPINAVNEILNKNELAKKSENDDSLIKSYNREIESGDAEPNKPTSNGNILIKNATSYSKKGINIGVEMPSVRHLTMSPGSKKFGGDDVEIAISPLFDVILQMPDQIEYFRASNQILSVQTVPGNLNTIALKLNPVSDLVPMSLHLIDVNQNIYTFTVIGLPADLSYEYPKTILVNKRMSKKTIIGSKNPDSIFESMDIDDAIQVTVGDIPKTQEYFAEIVSFKYKHHEGFATYGFRIYKKDGTTVEPSDVTFTMWADDKRLDGGPEYRSSREVEWTIHPILTSRETKRRGYTVLRVFLQVTASILDIEEWKNTFITISDKNGYTRFDFKPITRPIRPPSNYENDETN